MKGKDLRIIFMGTPDFAVESLQALVDGGYNIVGVVTSPDRPAGRGRQIQESAIKKYATKYKLNILQPEKLKNQEFISQLRVLKADLQIVVAFRMLPEAVWSMPRLGTFNLHGSLLPQYRGAAPLNWAIINGEKETGVTTFLLSHEIDTGAILFNEKINIAEDDNLGSIHDKLMVIGAELVLNTVNALAEGKYTATEQDKIKVEILKPAPKIFKEDCKINWNKPAKDIFNLVRGLSPYPAAWTEISDSKEKAITMKIYSVQIGESCLVEPGTISTDEKTYIRISSLDKWLYITDLHLAGKKRMLVKDFLRGVQNAKEIKCI